MVLNDFGLESSANPGTLFISRTSGTVAAFTEDQRGGEGEGTTSRMVKRPLYLL